MLKSRRAALLSHLLTMFLYIKLSGATFGDALRGDGSAPPPPSGTAQVVWELPWNEVISGLNSITERRKEGDKRRAA